MPYRSPFDLCARQLDNLTAVVGFIRSGSGSTLVSAAIISGKSIWLSRTVRLVANLYSPQKGSTSCDGFAFVQLNPTTNLYEVVAKSFFWSYNSGPNFQVGKT